MSFRLHDIAAALGSAVQGNQDLLVSGLSEPAGAASGELALAMTPHYATALAASAARAAIVWPGCDWRAHGLEAAIEVPRARLAMAHLTQAFDPVLPPTGIHPTAVIDPAAHVCDGVSIGPFAVIGADVRIGDDSRIGAHVSIASGSVVGAQCRIGDGARIGSRVALGDRVILQPNVVIGGDGFSFVTAGPSNEERALKSMGRQPLDPPEDGTRHRIHSLGGVMIGDDVEIGANSTVDAGTIRPTKIGRGSKIDNLVQVGHNVIVGEDCVLCAQAAVAGSAQLGDRVVMGGKSGIRDNVKIGRDVVLGGGAIVLGPLDDGAFVAGYPAQPMPDHRAAMKALRRLQKDVQKSGKSD